MKIAAAQFGPNDGDINYNLDEHYRLIRLAAENGVQLILFPEMSITGYVKVLADKLSFRENDPRMEKLRCLSAENNMYIVAGAPVKLGSVLHIASFAISPDNSVSIYTKQFLHTGEEKYFTSSFAYNPTIKQNGEEIALAICADITNPIHAENAYKAGCTMYAASICFTPGGMKEAYNLLGNYAKKFSMNVLMSNYCGESGGHEAGGKSAFWSEDGSLLAELDASDTGLIIGQKRDNTWEGFSIRLVDPVGYQD